MRLIFPIFILLLLSSCTRKTEIEKLLTDKSKHWVYIDNEKYNPNSIAPIYIRFNADETCENIWFENNKIHETGTWEFSESDSLLIVFEREFSVLKIEPDTIYVKYKSEDVNALFINLDDQN